VEIFDTFGAAFPLPALIKVKFCAAKRTQVPVGRAEFDVNRCNESPMMCEKPDFWRKKKLNFAASRLSVTVITKKNIQPEKRCTIFRKLCKVIALVEAIKKLAFIFRSNAYFFLQGVWKNSA